MHPEEIWIQFYLQLKLIGSIRKAKLAFGWRRGPI